jgi:hypothetical protein
MFLNFEKTILTNGGLRAFPEQLLNLPLSRPDSVVPPVTPTPEVPEVSLSSALPLPLSADEPAAWSASVLDARYAGSSFDASAGPGGGFGPGGGARAAGGVRQFGSYGRFGEGRPRGEFGDFPGGGTIPGSGAPGGEPGGGAFRPGGAGGGLFDTATTLTGSQLRLYRYLTAHRDGARYLFAVQGWTAAGPYILATGQAVLPMGGFSGSVPEPTLARVKQLVATGQLRVFMLDGGGGFAGPGGRGGGETAQIDAWVESSCRTVQVPGADSTGTLYQCGAR